MTNLVVAIAGVFDSGKTTTLRIVRDRLTDDLGGVVIDGFDGGGDFRQILEVRGVRVGIESQGDPGGRLARSLREFVEGGCQIIICACRSRGATRDAVTAYSDTHEVRILEKGRAANAEESRRQNAAFADQIIALVMPRLGS